MRQFTSGRIIAVIVSCFAAQGAAAQSVEQFYKSHPVTLYVASAPGGINDLTARLVARHMPDFLPGRPGMVVQNLTGGSGLTLANRLAVNAEKDGTAIAILERATPQLAVQGDANVRFDPLTLTWLGSVSSYANDAYLLQVNASFAANTVADLKKSGIDAEGTIREAEYGHLARRILTVVDEYDPRMLVLGARSRTDLPLLSFGSVSHHLLHLARRPVLIVPRHTDTAGASAAPEAADVSATA